MQEIKLILPIIEATDKNNKSIIETTEHMSVTQLEIKKRHNKVQSNTNKDRLQYLKARDKNIHQMNKNLIVVLMYQSSMMCHALIQDFFKMPPLLDMLLDSLDDFNLETTNVHEVNDEDKNADLE